MSASSLRKLLFCADHFGDRTVYLCRKRGDVDATCVLKKQIAPTPAMLNEHLHEVLVLGILGKSPGIIPLEGVFVAVDSDDVRLKCERWPCERTVDLLYCA